MPQIDDPARLEAVLAALPPADALWLSRQLEPAWRTAQRRRETRANALRAARDLVVPGLRPRPAAEALAAEVKRYLATAWCWQLHLLELFFYCLGVHRVLHRVAVLNGGKALAWRTVWEALRTL